MRFYVLDSYLTRGPNDTEIFGVNKVLDDCPYCPACGGVFGSLTWLPPYRIEVERRRKSFGDLVQATGQNFFLSESFHQAWLKCGLHGIDHFDPTEIVRVKPKKAALLVPVYWHIRVNRTSTAADLGRSMIAWDKPLTCAYCGRAGMDGVAGFFIDESTWTGEDLFIARNIPGTIIVTQRFADMITQYHLTNAILIPVEEYIWDPMHKLTLKPLGYA